MVRPCGHRCVLLWACRSSGASGAGMAVTTSRISVPQLCYKGRDAVPHYLWVETSQGEGRDLVARELRV